MGDDPNDRGASRRHLTRAAEASLRRLGTDWIDLYQVHWPDPAVPIEETLSTLDDLVSAGKIRYGGLSNYLGWEIQRGIDACDRYGWAPVLSHQAQYSLVCREIELEILPLCQANGIAVLPWSPLGAGVLTGKYNGSAIPSDARLVSEGQSSWRSEDNLQVADAVAKVAAQTDKSPAQVALNWVLHRDGVTSPLLGVRNLTQLDDNLGAEGWKLEASHVDALDRASRRPLRYPHDYYVTTNSA
jgi:aryl-alcohol dehydrogenase-like predicted oxidoreductase